MCGFIVLALSMVKENPIYRHFLNHAKSIKNVCRLLTSLTTNKRHLARVLVLAIPNRTHSQMRRKVWMPCYVSLGWFDVTSREDQFRRRDIRPV